MEWQWRVSIQLNHFGIMPKNEIGKFNAFLKARHPELYAKYEKEASDKRKQSYIPDTGEKHPLARKRRGIQK
jgi:hypothetical protein